MLANEDSMHYTKTEMYDFFKNRDTHRTMNRMDYVQAL